MIGRFALAVTAVMATAVLHAASDWPQWQGPDRTRMSKETGLLKEWPAGGPRLLWTANDLGTGYGSMSVAGDRVFLQGARGPNSIVIALNRADGKEVWAKPIDPPNSFRMFICQTCDPSVFKHARSPFSVSTYRRSPSTVGVPRA